MELPDRIKAIVDYSGLSIPKFAYQIGVQTPQAIRDLMSGKTRSLSKDMQQKILSYMPSLNAAWLFTGEGDMLKQMPHDEVEDLSPDEMKELKEDIRSGKATVIPLIPASAFAGDVKGLAPESISRAQCEMIVSPVNGAELAIPITGDSMEPDYPDGSLAYIKRINESAFIPWGHTVILDTENGAFIKRIYPDETNDQYVWAKSINPDYPPMHIPKSAIFRIFRVLGTSRIFTTM